MSIIRTLLAASIAALLCPLPAQAAGTLVVSGDDWVLAQSADADPLVRNIAGALGGHRYLLLDNDPYVDYPDVARTLRSLGRDVVEQATFVPADVAGADAVFLFGTLGGYRPEDRTVLEAFLSGGGSVFVQLGTGLYGSSSAEAAYWNPLLGRYGLHAAESFDFGTPAWYRPIVEASPSPLGVGVHELYWGGGQFVSAVPGREADVSIVWADFGDGAVRGALGLSATAPVPEPSTAPLLALGLLAVGLLRRRVASSARSRPAR